MFVQGPDSAIMGPNTTGKCQGRLGIPSSVLSLFIAVLPFPFCFLLSQHFQLLTQTFVLTRFEPSLVFLSQIALQAIVSVCTYFRIL